MIKIKDLPESSSFRFYAHSCTDSTYIYMHPNEPICVKILSSERHTLYHFANSGNICFAWNNAYVEEYKYPFEVYTW